MQENKELQKDIMELLEDDTFAGQYTDALQDEEAWNALTVHDFGSLGEALKQMDGDENKFEQLTDGLEAAYLCWWSGVYEPQEPEWMKSTAIVVTGENGKIQIGEETVDITEKDGKYRCLYQEKAFSVGFKKEYDGDGNVKDTWLEGTITGTQGEESLKAKLKNDEFHGLSSYVGLKEYLAFFGIIGSVMTIKGLLLLVVSQLYEREEPQRGPRISANAIGLDFFMTGLYVPSDATLPFWHRADRHSLKYPQMLSVIHREERMFGRKIKRL